MKHSVLHRRAMLEWIINCADEGRPMPTDGEIEERFGWTDDGSMARSLLVELSEAREITLTGFGATRVIALGKAKSPPLPVIRVDRVPKSAPKPTLMQSRRDLMAEIGTKLAAKRGGQAMPAPAPVVSKPAAPVAIVKVAPAPTPVAAPAPPSERPAPVQVTPPKRTQINLHVSRDLYLTVKAGADDAGVTVSRHALDLLEQAFTAKETVPVIKPRVTVTVYRAWQAGGMRQPLHVFVDDMLALGLAAVKHEQVMAA